MEEVSSCSGTWAYLKLLGVKDFPARTSAFDPGYDLYTLQGHLEQSSHLISCLKISMACWQIAAEEITVGKIKKARELGIPVCAGGGPFEVATYFDVLPEYFDLCAGLGMSRVEAGEGFTMHGLNPDDVVRLAEVRGLEVQFEVGEKHGGQFTPDVVNECISEGRRWLDAGAKQIVIEARESAEDIGVFGSSGQFDATSADRFVNAFGMEQTVFEAPDKSSQFALLNHFGPDVNLMNVRLEELLRVEIYRRGLHSDAFRQDNLRPGNINCARVVT
jgi:phosphosulfolactate synthase